MSEEFMDDEPMPRPICEVCRRLASTRTIMNSQGKTMIDVCQYCYWRNQADVRLHTMRQHLVSASLSRMAVWRIVDALEEALITPETIDVDPFDNIVLWPISANQAAAIRTKLRGFGVEGSVWKRKLDSSNHITGEFRHEFLMPSKIETEEGLFKGDIRIVQVDCGLLSEGGDS